MALLPKRSRDPSTVAPSVVRRSFGVHGVAPSRAPVGDPSMVSVDPAPANGDKLVARGPGRSEEVFGVFGGESGRSFFVMLPAWAESVDVLRGGLVVRRLQRPLSRSSGVADLPPEDLVSARLVGWKPGYTVSVLGIGDVTETPPPNQPEPFFVPSGGGTGGSLQGLSLTPSAQTIGTLNLGLPRSARSIIVRYGPSTVAAWPVPQPDSVDRVTIDVTTPPFVALDLSELPPFSRVFDLDRNTDITEVPPPGGGGGWLTIGSRRVWRVGIPSTTRRIRVKYPSGQERDFSVGTNFVEGIVAVAVPSDPGAPPPPQQQQPPPPRQIPPVTEPSPSITLRVRGARRDITQRDPLFTLHMEDPQGGVGANATNYQRPDGRAAGWDGLDWLIGIPRTTRRMRIRSVSSDQITGTIEIPVLRAEVSEHIISPSSSILFGEVRARDIPLSAEESKTDTIVSFEPNPLAGVRVWLIRPPSGVRLVASVETRGPGRSPPVVRDDELKLDVAQLALPVPGSDQRVTRTVAQGRLPDAADRSVVTRELHAVSADGSRTRIPLSHLPSDGILRIDLGSDGLVPVDGRGQVAPASRNRIPTIAVVAVAVAAGAGIWWWLGRREKKPRENPRRRGKGRR